MEHDDPIDVDRTSARSPRWVLRSADALGRVRPWLAWFGAGRLVGAALTIALGLGGAWWLFRPDAPPLEATLPYATTPATTASAALASPVTTSPGAVVVHVAGAVAAPGVYSLPAGTRVVDGVTAAGGGAPDADLSALNLAATLRDGERVYVPRVGEPPPPARAGPSASEPPTGPVDLNQAGIDELNSLPGIGPTTAAAIVAFRDEHGPFADVAALEQVPGIGPAKLAALAGLVTT